MHNMYVQSRVPKENLLIWNLKDGWEPVCTFLNKPIPDDSIPRENQTGDIKWAEDYLLKTDLFKNGMNYLVVSLLIILTIIITVPILTIKYCM